LAGSLAETLQTLDLNLVELRKHQVLAGLEDRRHVHAASELHEGAFRLGVQRSIPWIYGSRIGTHDHNGSKVSNLAALAMAKPPLKGLRQALLNGLRPE